MDTISFHGKEYPCRWIYFDNSDYNRYLLVSTEQLEEQLFDQFQNYTSWEAVRIDEAVFFYVPLDIITSEENRICEFITQNI